MERKATFGDVLRLLRMKAGYTSQRAFARAAGVPHMTLVSIENGKSKLPNSDTMTRIAEALGLSLDQLMSRTQPVVSYVPEEDERTKIVESDAIEVSVSEEAPFEDFEFKPSNRAILLKVISDNLESFGIKRNDYLSLRVNEDVEAGHICALGKTSHNGDMKEFCIRRKVLVETLSKPGLENARIMYILDDLRRFTLMISPDNVNFTCAGVVKDQVRSR